MSQLYKSGNNVPSSAMVDVWDNASTLDSVINGNELKVVTRTGVERDSLAGIQEKARVQRESLKLQIEGVIKDLSHKAAVSLSVVAAAAQEAIQEINSTVTQTANEAEIILSGLGYLPPVNFEAGLSISSSRFTVTYNENTYAAIAGKIPFVTNKDFEPSQWRLLTGVMSGDVMNIVNDADTVVHTMPGPSGDSAIDTARLQAALEKGGVVNCLVPGTYYYNSTSTIHSNTKLVIGHGVTWEKDVNSEWGPFIRNSAFGNPHLAITSMAVSNNYNDAWKDNVTSSGLTSYINVACSGHGYTAGDYVAFYGAVEFGFDGIMKVVSVKDTNNFVVEAHNLPNGMSATFESWANGLFCFKADENISVEIHGRIDGRCTELNPAGEPKGSPNALYLMGMIFHGIMNGNLYINSVRRYRKYSALIANVRNFIVPFANIDNYSDGLHFMPPYVGVHIKTIVGAGGDDIFALTGGDFAHYEISRGHGYDIKCDNLVSQNALCAVKITGNAPYKFWNIDIGKISGLTQTDVIKAIWDTNLTYTAIGTLKIGTFDCAPQMGHCLKLTADEIGSVIVDDFVIAQKKVGGYDIVVGDSTKNFCTVNNIRVKNVRLKHKDVQVNRLLHLGRDSLVNNAQVTCGYIDIKNLTDSFVFISPSAGTAYKEAKILNLKLDGSITGPLKGGDLIAMQGRADVFDFTSLKFYGLSNLLRAYELAGSVNNDKVLIKALGIDARNINRLFTIYGGKWRIAFSGERIYPATGLTPVYHSYNTDILLEGHAIVEGARETLSLDRVVVNAVIVPNTGAKNPGDSDPAARSTDRRNKMLVDNVFNPQYGDELTDAIEGRQNNQMKYTYFGWVPFSDWRDYQRASDATASIYYPKFNRGNVWHVNGITRDISIMQAQADWSMLTPGSRYGVLVTQDGVGGHSVTFDRAVFTLNYETGAGGAGTSAFFEFVYQGGGRFYSAIPAFWA
ncbi:hypothetical protein [Pluralibacter gergoviae]|uniref:hypothetical protein n=1 Tax=Pluralibacter gergoviae TaxID=61647 RepID=UPI00388EBA21